MFKDSVCVGLLQKNTSITDFTECIFTILSNDIFYEYPSSLLLLFLARLSDVLFNVFLS